MFLDTIIVLSFQWFWECLCLMGKADESTYSIKLPGMNETTTPDSPRSTLLSLSTLSPLSTSINDSNYLQQHNATTSVKRKRRKESNSTNETNITPTTKRFNSSNENENGLDDDLMISDSFDKQPKTPIIKKDNKYLIGMEIRETERNYVTMLSNIIRVRSWTRTANHHFSFFLSFVVLQNWNGERRSSKWTHPDQSRKQSNLRQYRRDLPFACRYCWSTGSSIEWRCVHWICVLG